MSDNAERLLNFITEKFKETGKDTFKKEECNGFYNDQAVNELINLGHIRKYVNGSITIDKK